MSHVEEWEYGVRDYRPPYFLSIAPLDPNIPEHLDDIRKLYGERPIVRRRPPGTWMDMDELEGEDR